MEILDSLIVGSSPIAIIEAVYLKSKKKAVINIDERGEIGGAWTTIKHDGFPEVESGCHIWSYNKETYFLIRDLFDIELKELKPQPSILYKKKMIPYDWKSNVIAAQKIIKNLGQLKSVLAAPDVRFSLSPSKYLYPSGGSLELKRALKKLVKKESLKINLNIVVDKVLLNKDNVELYGLDDKLIAITKELVLTSLSKLSSITLEDGTEIKPNTRKVDYIHVHLILEDVIGKPFSYIRTNGNDVIHRISDMSFQVQNSLNSNQKLFCVGVFSEQFYNKSPEELKTYIYKFILDNKLISKEAKIINYTTNIYPSYYNDSSFIDEIKNQAKGKIRFLRSTDFVYSFFNQKERYKKLLSSNPK
jgi:hypothetical protein